MFAGAQYPQHLRAGAANSDAHQAAVCVLVVEDEQQRLMAERCGADLHPPRTGKAILDRYREVAGLLRLDQHLGCQLCELGRRKIAAIVLDVPACCAQSSFPDEGPVWQRITVEAEDKPDAD